MTLDEYEKSGYKLYAQLAATISAILAAAIAKQPEIRLQQLQHRGKDPTSLRTKLIDRGLQDPPDLAKAVKDLAGCRAIFYTNADAKGFEQSGIIRDNFEIDWERTKRHHPLTADAAPFISINLVICLKDGRTALPEYADLAGLWCELQIQTTLNHAWSEMEHDMVYKMPKVEGFGERAMEQVKARLNGIMRRHLIPAGHEFSKVLHDFERLRQGRNLFDRNALEEIAAAPDNNQRDELIERFASHVLPNYDDVAAVWPDIRTTLLAAVEQVRATEPVAIETPFGNLPGRGADRVEGRIAGIFKSLRYIDIEQTFDDAAKLYETAPDEASRERWLEVLKSLSENNIAIWRKYGPAVQLRLVQHLQTLGAERHIALRKPMLAVLGNALKTSASGTFSATYDTFTFEEATLPQSDALRAVRDGALTMLMALFTASEDHAERVAILSTLNAATRPPMNAGYNDEMHAALIRDAVKVVDFYSASRTTLSYELNQQIEHDLLLLHHRYRAPPETVGDGVRAEAPALMDAIVAFRDALNADEDFVIYKTLVGFRSVFSEAWTGRVFDHSRDHAHRQAMIARYVDEITPDTLPLWQRRIERCAATNSRDGATFPMFTAFLERLGEFKPDLALDLIGGLAEPLAAWSPALLLGLTKGGRADEVNSLLDRWIAEKRFIAYVLRYLRLATEAEPGRLRAAYDVAREQTDFAAIFDAAFAAIQQRATAPELVAEIALPTFAGLSADGRFGWVSELSHLAYGDGLDGAFDEKARSWILHLMEAVPVIDYDDEQVLALLTRGDRASLFGFFERRLARDKADELESTARYDAVPFHFQVLAELPELPDLAGALVEQAYGWFQQDPDLFKYRGGRVLRNFYPDLPESLQQVILAFVDGRVADAGDFAVSILRSYDGEAFPLGFAHDLIERLPLDDSAWVELDLALSQTGVVSGAFGFVEIYRQRMAEIEPWLHDTSDAVRGFAAKFRHGLSQMIAAEQQRAEEGEAMRRLAFELPESSGDGG